MHLFFGKPKAGSAATAAQPQAQPQVNIAGEVARLQAHMENLEKAKVQQEKKAQAALQAALLKKKKGDQKGALFELKRHKVAKQQIDKYCAMQENTEALVTAMQNTNMNREQLNAMNQATGALKVAQADVNVEKMEEVREQFDEVMDTHQEVEREFGQAWVRSDIDEDDLLAELEGLSEADLTADLVAAPAAVAPVAAGAGAVAVAPVAAASVSPVPATIPAMPVVPTGRVEAAAVPPSTKPVAPAKEMDMMAELAGLE